MSTLEMPACLALLLVMANLALCLSAERRSFGAPMDPPANVTLDGAAAVTLCGDAAARALDPAPAGAANC
jgi:hypothetical protein